jgi:hypothetical protein
VSREHNDRTKTLTHRYIGSEKAIADLPFFNGNFASGGGAAMLFWRSAYVVSCKNRF